MRHVAIPGSVGIRRERLRDALFPLLYYPYVRLMYIVSNSPATAPNFSRDFRNDVPTRNTRTQDKWRNPRAPSLSFLQRIRLDNAR